MSNVSNAVVLKIAGTSCGGSSYNQRIIKALNGAVCGSRLEIFITPGSKQEEVKLVVEKGITELRRFLSMMGAKSQLNIKISLL